MAPEPIAPPILAGLKEFQHKTVEYVFRRLYTDPDAVHRFLVADEVGLGKTLVARGVVAKAIDRLQAGGVKRVDIVYICSNAEIANQNLNRLNVTTQSGLNHATRVTLLATQLHALRSTPVNFVSFTPGTSFEMGDQSGRRDERALVYWLLVHAWGSRRLRHPGVFRALRGGAGEQAFESYVRDQFPWRRVGRTAGQIDEAIAERFRALVNAGETDGQDALRDRFEALAERLRRRDRRELAAARQQVVGELRARLAQSSIDAIEPDLIILDEFQRFRRLLDAPTGPDGPTALAHQLFNYENGGGHARTLLLSATPYKMYTLAAEAGDDDHYADFVRTSEFLLGDDAARLRGELRAYHTAVLELPVLGPEIVRRRRMAVERRLRRVMVRTERLAATPHRSGMLVEPDVPPAPVEPDDLRAFVALDRVSRALGADDAVEYWKSAPYPLSFMDGYDVKRRLRAASSAGTLPPDAVGALAEGAGLLDPAAIRAYRRLDPGNARLRALAGDVLESEAWRLLWIPPSLPYYRPRGPYASKGAASFTKRLVFSAWTVVPQAVASTLSYEAERRMMQARDPAAANTPEARRRLRSLLQFRTKDGTPGAMSVLALVLPSPALARLTDPLELAAGEKGRGVVSGDAILAKATERVARALRPLIRRAPKDGPVDEDWYWAAPMLLEQRLDPASLEAFLTRPARDIAAAWTSAGDGPDGADLDGFVAHLDEVRGVLDGRLQLGRPPDDLTATLALIGIASPANTALRMLARGPSYQRDLTDPAVRAGACRISWGLRSLFGVPEVIALVRGRSGSGRGYWRRVLGYCFDGNLQATLDEYGHVVPDWLGLLQAPAPSRAAAVADAAYAALSIRAPLYGFDAIGGDGVAASQRMRARFALRYGVDTTDEEAAIQRSGQVLRAFNSPFWPFVLVTTSIGQEGLDFHQYCHAVVHWNLPANPVDFEQREGRVHRYKGHAVRRNVAAAHRREAFAGRVDPWSAMFAAARRSPQARGRQDLVPYWVYEGKHHIERYVPTLPLSREIEQLDQLKKSLAAYRLVFGQPRQEDLLAYLRDRTPSTGLEPYLDALRIDLAPPGIRGDVGGPHLVGGLREPGKDHAHPTT